MQLVSGQQSNSLPFCAVAWSCIYHAVCSGATPQVEQIIYSLYSCMHTQEPGQWFYSLLLRANIALKPAALSSCQYQSSTHSIKCTFSLLVLVHAESIHALNTVFERSHH